MRTNHAAVALWLCATLAVSACEKPPQPLASDRPSPAPVTTPPAATATASAEGQPDSTTHLYNAGPNSTWDLVANVGDSAGYVAPSSYQLLGDHRVAIGEKITKQPATPDGEAYTIWVMEIDCARHTQKATAHVTYDAADKPLGHADIEPSDQKEIAAEDGTVAYGEVESICKALPQD